jgi:hypothetical protein
LWAGPGIYPSGAISGALEISGSSEKMPRTNVTNYLAALRDVSIITLAPRYNVIKLFKAVIFE